MEGKKRSVELSAREAQIAQLLVTGHAAARVAVVLSISEHTVRTYVRRLYRKLGVNSRAALAHKLVVAAVAVERPPERPRDREPACGPHFF